MEDQNAPVNTATATPPPAPTGPSPARRGKVARLPKAVRDKINHMLEDGVSYHDIIASLGPEGVGLTENSLSTWKAGGHQDWIREQAELERFRLRQDAILDLLRDKDPTEVNAAALQLAATKLSEFLIDFNPRMLSYNLEQHPERYSSLINALVRLSDAAVRCHHHRGKEAEREHRIKNPPGIVTAETLRKAEKALRLM